jgi:hypothetical protein
MVMEPKLDFSVVDNVKLKDRLDDISKSVELALEEGSVYDVVAHMEFLKFRLFMSEDGYNDDS